MSKILWNSYYYIFPPENDHYTVIEYNPKYNELIEYTDNTFHIQYPSAWEHLKDHTYKLGQRISNSTKDIFKYMGQKSFQIAAELYYRDYKSLPLILPLKLPPIRPIHPIHNDNFFDIEHTIITEEQKLMRNLKNISHNQDSNIIVSKSVEDFFGNNSDNEFEDTLSEDEVSEDNALAWVEETEVPLEDSDKEESEEEEIDCTLPWMEMDRDEQMNSIVEDIMQERFLK